MVEQRPLKPTVEGSTPSPRTNRCPHCGWDGVMRWFADGHRMNSFCLKWAKTKGNF